MFRVTGIILAFLASSLIGFMKSNEIKKRKSLLEDFRELTELISTRIGYFKEPLPVVFYGLLSETEGEIRSLLENCLMSYEMGQKDINTVWNTAVETVYGNEPLSDDDLRVLSKCGQFLGQSDYDNQIKHFSLLNRQLDKQIEDSIEQIRTKGKMYSRMGVSLGALIAIALI